MCVNFSLYLIVAHNATLLYHNLLSFFLLKLLAKSDRCHNMSHLTKLIFRLHPAIFVGYNIFMIQFRFTSNMVQIRINHIKESDAKHVQIYSNVYFKNSVVKILSYIWVWFKTILTTHTYLTGRLTVITKAVPLRRGPSIALRLGWPLQFPQM